MHFSETDTRSLLDQIERYYDAVPRSSARAEDFGPLTLFVPTAGSWPFYGRPALAWQGPAATAGDVRRVRERQRELGLPETFEWVDENAPGLRAAVEAAGLTVHAHPLMALDPGAPTPPSDPSVRLLAADAPELASALAVPRVAFAEPGTAVGTAGAAELAAFTAVVERDGTVDRVAARIRAGLTVTAAALAADGSARCSGMHQPVDGVTEVVGVGTLPDARRRGLALAVTACLVADARARGAGTVFLSAGDEDVARVYARAGFRRVATALIAEPAESA
ncbi:GNAT family N-acetyltransferase [Kitasatospora sp. MBT63]|uniref:GNAT family N-acetyltransferase n=1 Tax=Kitasatospora sp. MBT63 TaxID=1444768 RepID=UPI00053A3BF3|nr:GNAT family N-acetyltransferase [Kitasatospora sp. MBT63]